MFLSTMGIMDVLIVVMLVMVYSVHNGLFSAYDKRDSQAPYDSARYATDAETSKQAAIL